MSMQIGLIGAGRMGGGIARRLARHGHRCVVHDRDRERAAAVAASAPDRLAAAASADELLARLPPPRVVWLMLPAGDPTERTIAALGARLTPGDVIIDGANTFYRDDVRRERELRARGVEYLDVGVSGGIWGEDAGFCLMVGGKREVFDRLRPVLEALAPGTPTPGTEPDAKAGFLHCGPTGAGHFVKMIHNGIEYGLMEAYAEGFDLLRGAAARDRDPGVRYELPLADIAEVWRRGSVVRSWLLDLIALGLTEDRELSGYADAVADSGEGRWTVREAVEQGRAAEVIAAALAVRLRSQDGTRFGNRLLSAMRHQFGGHGRGPSTDEER